MAWLTQVVTRSGMVCPDRGRAVLAVAMVTLGLSTAGNQAAGQSLLPFPTSPAGYDQQLGVTVQSRLRPEFDAPGVQLGSFVVRPNLDETLGYNSDPTGAGTGGSGLSHTAAAVAVTSLWSRDSFSASAGVDRYDYVSLPELSHTDWHAGVAGGYTIIDSQLTAAYFHQTYHEFGTAIGTVRSLTPAEDQIDTARIGYTYTLNRLSLTPELTASAYQFGPATVLGTRVDQSFLNRDVLAGGVTARYALNDVGSFVLSARGVQSTFVKNQPGQPSNSSTSAVVLSGLDFQPKGPWRFQLLAGAELRTFQAAQYASRVTPVVEGGATWTPTGVLTLMGDISRTIDDPEAGGTIGFVLTQITLRADYELRRDVLLHARGTVQYAEFLQQGTQTSYNGELGTDWLINRNVRLSLTGDYTKQTGSGSSGTAVNSLDATINPSAIRSGAFDQGIVALTLHLAL